MINSLTNKSVLGYDCNQVIKTLYQADNPRPTDAGFLRPLFSMAGCAENTIPEREIISPTWYGFEHLAAFSKKANSKVYQGVQK
jgi:hypothetical protein